MIRIFNKKQNPKVKTTLLADTTKSVITYSDSPDLGHMAGINPYRGCEHGCVYCFARPNHEYLGFSSGLDFETKIMVKKDAPRLLRKELLAKKYKPQVIALSGNTDCYQPIERRLKITRQCLEVLADFRNPVAIITKSRLVERDMDIFLELNKYNAIKVIISLTTLDHHLASKLEPRASTPEDRLHAIKALSQAGIPVGIMVAPVIPALNEYEIPMILKKASEAEATSAGYILVRLPFAVKDLFTGWLQEHFPEHIHKHHQRDMHSHYTLIDD